MGQPTLRQLQAFHHIYRLGSLTRAARALHLTQSAVSVLLQQLEESLGVLLFERTSRQVRPTAAAHDAFASTVRMLNELEHLMGQARNVAQRRHGVLNFGVTTAVAATIMPQVISRFEAQYPDVHLVMHDTAPDRLLPPVQNGDVEFTVGTSDLTDDGVAFTPLLTDSLSIICRQDSPLARLDKATWAHLSGVPVISVRTGSPIRTLIDNAMLEANVVFTPRWEVSYLATALAMTAHGLGVSVLPGYLVTASSPSGLLTRPLHEPSVARNLYLITRQGAALSSLGQALVDVIREVLTPT